MEDATYLFGGKQLTREDAVKYPIMVPRADFANPALVFVFESESSFLAWAQGTEYGSAIAETLSKIARVRELEGSDVAWIMERQKLKLKRISEDLNMLAERTGLAMGSEELFSLATEPTNPLEEPIFDPIQLCVNPGSNCWLPWPWWGNNMLALGGGLWPDFRWFGWNDRASSYRVTGEAYLYEHIWFGGRSVFLLGHPAWAGDLSYYGFDDMASSAAVA